MELMREKICRLRCVLCRYGLLKTYSVYLVPVDEYGAKGTPELIAYTAGYFYSKHTRHYSGVLELAGEIQERKGHDFRLLVFDDNASVGNLILIDGAFFRVDFARVIDGSCRLLDLEDEQIEGNG